MKISTLVFFNPRPAFVYQPSLTQIRLFALPFFFRDLPLMDSNFFSTPLDPWPFVLTLVIAPRGLLISGLAWKFFKEKPSPPLRWDSVCELHYPLTEGVPSQFPLYLRLVLLFFPPLYHFCDA